MSMSFASSDAFLLSARHLLSPHPLVMRSVAASLSLSLCAPAMNKDTWNKRVNCIRTAGRKGRKGHTHTSGREDDQETLAVSMRMRLKIASIKKEGSNDQNIIKHLPALVYKVLSAKKRPNENAQREGECDTSGSRCHLDP